LQHARRLADRFLKGIFGKFGKGFVDVDDLRAGFVERMGLGDDDDVSCRFHDLLETEVKFCHNYLSHQAKKAGARCKPDCNPIIDRLC
jgi:hypothetical protein